MTAHAPAPLTPPTCDLKDFPRMMIDIPRLFGSGFDATGDDTAWRCGLTLWLKSWHQVPAASLDDDEALLAKLAGLGRDMKTWARVRAGALRHWVKCSDGRLYHPVVAEIALEAWLSKLAQQVSSGSGANKRWGTPFDPAPFQAHLAEATEMLRLLNPESKALRRPARSDPPPSTPDATGNADGIPSASQRQSRRQSRAMSVGNADPMPIEGKPGNIPSSRGDITGPGVGERAHEGRALPAWEGPDRVWAAVVEAKGADWARDILALTGWRDLPQPTVVCRTAQVDREIRRSVTRLLDKLGVGIAMEAAA